MNGYMWIKETGAVQEEELYSELQRKLRKDSLFLACGTNFFLAGHAVPEELAGVNVEKLLELRIFSDEEEVYYSRSCIGEAFQWRFASEKGLPQKYYITQYQTIDINRDKVKQENDPADQYGNRIFYTTVGGEYVLPIDGEADSSEVVCYLAYDKNGMAKVADYRLRRFVAGELQGKEVKNHG